MLHFEEEKKKNANLLIMFLKLEKEFQKNIFFFISLTSCKIYYVIEEYVSLKITLVHVLFYFKKMIVFL